MADCNLHTIVRLPNSVFKPYASIGTNLLFFEKGEPTTKTWFYEHRVPEGQKAYSMTKPIRVEHLHGCVDWWGASMMFTDSLVVFNSCVVRSGEWV